MGIYGRMMAEDKSVPTEVADDGEDEENPKKPSSSSEIIQPKTASNAGTAAEPKTDSIAGTTAAATAVTTTQLKTSMTRAEQRKQASILEDLDQNAAAIPAAMLNNNPLYLPSMYANGNQGVNTMGICGSNSNFMDVSRDIYESKVFKGSLQTPPSRCDQTSQTPKVIEDAPIGNIKYGNSSRWTIQADHQSWKNTVPTPPPPKMHGTTQAFRESMAAAAARAAWGFQAPTQQAQTPQNSAWKDRQQPFPSPKSFSDWKTANADTWNKTNKTYEPRNYPKKQDNVFPPTPPWGRFKDTQHDEKKTDNVQYQPASWEQTRKDNDSYTAASSWEKKQPDKQWQTKPDWTHQSDTKQWQPPNDWKTSNDAWSAEEPQHATQQASSINQEKMQQQKTWETTAAQQQTQYKPKTTWIFPAQLLQHELVPNTDLRRNVSTSCLRRRLQRQ